MTTTNDSTRHRRRISAEQTAALQKLNKALRLLEAVAPQARDEVEEVRTAVANFIAAHYSAVEKSYS
jgi:hypothetical protein